MKQINVAMIPEIFAKIVKELELIDEWLDLRIGSEKDDAIGKQEEWLNIYELCNMIPGRPRITTVRGWMYSEKIPYYMSGGTPVFRKKEIEAWIPRAMKYGIGDFFTRSRKYRESQYCTTNCTLYTMQTIPFSYFLPQSGGIVICFYFDQKKILRDSSIKTKC